jgi:hypothetical protein
MLVAGNTRSIASHNNTSLGGACTPCKFVGNILVILLYGSYFTVLLSFFYIPIYIALLHFGHRLLNNFFPLPDPATNQWKQLDLLQKEFKLRQAWEAVVHNCIKQQ